MRRCGGPLFLRDKDGDRARPAGRGEGGRAPLPFAVAMEEGEGGREVAGKRARVSRGNAVRCKGRSDRGSADKLRRRAER